MKYFVLLLSVLSAVNGRAQNWDAIVDFGPSTGVHSFYPDTVDDLLYIGGYFQYQYGEDTIPTPYIAVWDGFEISTLGCGFQWDCDPDNEVPSSGLPTVNSIVKYQGLIHVSGNVYEANGVPFNHVAHWNGEEWLATGDGFDVPPLRLRVIRDTLFAGGVFTSSGETPLNGLAFWNGDSWEDYHDFPNFWSNGGPNVVHDMVEYQGEIYIGGNWDNGTSTDELVKWNGSEWVGVPNGFFGGLAGVHCLAVYHDRLYVAGTYNQGESSLNPGNYIAAYDGENWDDLDGGSNFQVNYIYSTDDYLYAVGTFDQIGGANALALAHWDDNEWCGYGYNDDDSYFYEPFLYSVCEFRDTLYVGGSFTEVDGDTNVNQIARYIGTDLCLLSSVEDQPEILGGFSITPNPATSSVQLKGLPSDKPFSVEISDATGRIIVRTKNQTQINVASLLNGIYFLKVEGEGWSKVRKWVKE